MFGVGLGGVEGFFLMCLDVYGEGLEVVGWAEEVEGVVVEEEG